MSETKLRINVYLGVTIVILALLGFRLVQLQLIQREKYENLSEGTGIINRPIIPARGLLLDRNGEVLAFNKPTFGILLQPKYFKEENAPLLASLIGATPEDVLDKLQQARTATIYEQSLAYREITFEQLAKVEENLYRLPGVEPVQDQKRQFVGVRMSHAAGYIRQINKSQLEKYKELGYRLGDLVGQSGLESSYEQILRGQVGARYIMKNNRGQEVGPYDDGQSDVKPVSGYNLELTIDKETQMVAEQAMKNKRGAVVAINPNTGGIISMVSAPDFNPDLMSGRMNADVYKGLYFDDKQKTLFNRATMAALPPGSTFKPFMALVGLQEKAVQPDTRLYCAGGWRFGRFFKCTGVHGGQDAQHAVTNSCNAYFNQLMLRINFDHWTKWGHRFGLGTELPYDGGEQVEGLIPDSTFFDKNYGGRKGWTRGYLVSMGIGQGAVQVTPMQVARYVASVANKGTLYPPHFVHRMINPETGDTLYPKLPEPIRFTKKINNDPYSYIEPRNYEIVRAGMKNMVESKLSALRFGVEMAGKTGTVQNSRGANSSWFIGFAPFDKPKIAVAVYVENAGYGAKAAAPVAMLVLNQFLKADTALVRKRLPGVSSIRSANFTPITDWTKPKSDVIYDLELKKGGRSQFIADSLAKVAAKEKAKRDSILNINKKPEIPKPEEQVPKPSPASPPPKPPTPQPQVQPTVPPPDPENDEQ